MNWATASIGSEELASAFKEPQASLAGIGGSLGVMMRLVPMLARPAFVEDLRLAVAPPLEATRIAISKSTRLPVALHFPFQLYEFSRNEVRPLDCHFSAIL